MKYKNWLEIWLENYIKPTSKQKTYERYKDIIKNHLNSSLGKYELKKLSVNTVQKYINELLNSGNLKTGEGLSANTVNGIITLIKSSVKASYSLGYIKEYNLDNIKRPRTNEKKIECFSIREQKKIEEYILSTKNERLFGVILCLYTGLRIGEALALKWDDINFKKGEIDVNKSCYQGVNKSGLYERITDTPKTKSSIRTVPIPKQIIPYLKEIKRTSKAMYLISNKEKPVTRRSYQRSFELILKKLNIKHRGFHALRHTFATRALECGMDVKTLSEIMGHKSPTITLNRYAHSLIEHKREMMNKVGKLL